VNIAEQAMVIAGIAAQAIIDVPRMAEIAERMTRESLTLVRGRGPWRAILARDDEVDG
jgi:hypothetical protein